MPRVQDDVKSGNIKNIYLLYGEEAYLRNYYKNLLKKALVTEGDNLNYSYFEGERTDVSQVTDLINTMPFLADKRVIIVENSGWFAKASASDNEESEAVPEKKKGGNTDALYSALESLSEDVVVIFAEPKADKRSKLFKLIDKNGVCEEYPQCKEDYLIRWVGGYAANNGKKMGQGVCSYFINEVGTDMYVLSLELEKLIAWCLDRDEITVEDIDYICTHKVNNKIFDMIRAISEHKRKEALKLYYDLLTLRESPYHILALLVRQYNQMLSVRSMLDNDMGIAQICATLSSPDWLVRKIVDSVRRISVKQIEEYLSECAVADEDIKSGNITDTLSIELLIISCSQQKTGDKVR